MKRVISACLIMFIIFSLFTITAGATTENLLINGDFESGKTDSWVLNGPACKVEAVKEAAHSGKYGVSISNRTGRYSTIAQDLYETYYNNGPGTYRASVWVKLTNAVDERVKCQLVISYAESGKEMRWLTSRALSLTTEWQEFVIETNINISVYELDNMLIYPQVESAASENNYDFCFDDMTFVKVSEVIKPDPNYVDVDVVENATTENLIENGDFETGDEDGFVKEGSISYEFDKKYAHSGEYGMLVTERGHNYSTVRWDILDQYVANGPGQYRACVYVRLANKLDEAKNIMCELVVRYSSKGESTRYIANGYKKITTKWTKIILDSEINVDPMMVRELSLYPQVIGDNSKVVVEFYVDDATLYKTSPIIEPSDDYVKVEDIPVDTKLPVKPIDMTNINRDPGYTTVGAIRWDAWYGHDGIAKSVISEVEKTLSPSEFHFRAPFFAEVTKDNKITIPEYTQEIFDKEMEYAIDAGIDYFAFYWYSDAMQKARQYYQTSKYNDKVKMCVMFSGQVGDADEHQEMAKLLQSDYYMTVLGGRPLLYFDTTYAGAKPQIIYYRRLCAKLGLPEPYCVITKGSPNDVKNAYADAKGDYAIASNSKKNITFRELADGAVSRWKEYQANKAQVQYVPIVTTGYHLLPRYKNQVYWMKVDTDKVAEYATAEEIGTHLTEALEYMQQSEVIHRTRVNTVLMYAWNEHDEGGWICPTLKVDENGNQMYGPNGEKLIDTSRIEAVKKAIADYKEKYKEAAFDVPPLPTEAPIGNNNNSSNDTTNNNGNLWIYIAGGAVVVVAAAVTVFIVIKKKKNKGAVEDEQ